MKKSKQKHQYHIMLAISGAIFLAGLAFEIVFAFNPNLFGEATVVGKLVVIFVSTIFGFGVVFSSLAIRMQSEFTSQLLIENTYTLGEESTFYNLNAFKQKVVRYTRYAKLKDKKQTLIVFSTASLETSFNTFKNEDMMRLNYLVSQMLEGYNDKHQKDPILKYNVYGFNRGAFLVYTFVEKEELITEFISKVMTNIFDIVKEENLKIWVQPFFGVRDIQKDDNLVAAIEDAFIARSIAEANFESVSKFVPKLTGQEAVNFLTEIQNALKNNEFVPYYQPKYSLRKKEIVSSEVLARWQSPTRGLLTPGAFIDKAEQFGLLSAIDIYIFEAALKDISDSLRRGRRVLPVSTNFSLYEFFSHSFLDTIVDLLKKYQVPPSLVEIEITETTSQVNQFMSVSVIKKLKDLGIRVLMDDYGVGYSQIDNLKNIPFDAIKIDKSFTDQLLEDEKTRSIVKFLTELGHVNNMEVIIEGVEKKEQVDILRKMGVDTIQGFYYSKAMSYKDFEEFLKTNQFEGGKK